MTLNRSLLRGLALLEALSIAREPLGPAKLAEQVGLDKATVSRFLMTFQHAGYVAHHADTGRYSLTNRVLRLSQGFLAHSDLRSLARPHLSRLRDDTGETVHLGQLDGDRVVYIDKLEAAQSLRLVSSVGQNMPVHTTALGKAMLSAMSPTQAHGVVEQIDFTPRTEHSITDPAVLFRELEQIAAQGYSTDREENEPNVFCVGAPICDERAQAVAAISLSGPKFRIGPRVEEFGEQCRATAGRISAEVREAQLAAPPRSFDGHPAAASADHGQQDTGLGVRTSPIERVARLGEEQ